MVGALKTVPELIDVDGSSGYSLALSKRDLATIRRALALNYRKLLAAMRRAEQREKSSVAMELADVQEIYEKIAALVPAPKRETR